MTLVEMENHAFTLRYRFYILFTCPVLGTMNSHLLFADLGAFYRSLLKISARNFGCSKRRRLPGIEAAKAPGVYKGRPAALKNTKAAKARLLKARGFSAQETAEALGVSRRTVLRYLKSN
jgi:hypothetical protein